MTKRRGGRFYFAGLKPGTYDGLADSVDFFHLDALSSAVALNIDFDVLLSVDGDLFTEGETGNISQCTPFSCESRNMEDLTGTFDRGVGIYRVIDGELRFAFLATLFGDTSIPASDGVVPVLAMEVCLNRGTIAGECPTHPTPDNPQEAAVNGRYSF